MATANPFDLLGDFDNDDPSQLIAAQQPKMEQKKALAPTQSPAQQPAARLPSKPPPPAQAGESVLKFLFLFSNLVTLW